MKTELNSKDYVSFARRWVQESVDNMGVDELRDFVINALHEDMQEIYDDIGQSGVFDEMIEQVEGVFGNVANEYGLKQEDDFEDEEVI